MTVVETSVELIRRVRLAAPPVHRKFTDPLLSTTDLMSYGASRACGFPCEPFYGHLTVQLCRLVSKIILFPSSRVPSRRQCSVEEIPRRQVIVHCAMFRPNSIVLLPVELAHPRKNCLCFLRRRHSSIARCPSWRSPTCWCLYPCRDIALVRVPARWMPR